MKIAFNLALFGLFFFNTVGFTQTLPYSQNFNHLTNIAYLTGQSKLEGLPGWSYTASDFMGQLQVVSSHAYEGKSLVLNHSEYVYTTNNAILTLDLANYSADSSDILLDFAFANFVEEKSTKDRVFVRGNEEDEWLVLYEWDVDIESAYKWQVMQYLIINDTLVAHGQNFSATTQIRFGEYAYSNQRLYLDNVMVYERNQHDLECYALNLIKEEDNSGAHLMVTLINRGKEAQNKGVFNLNIEAPADPIVYQEKLDLSLSTKDTLHHIFKDLKLTYNGLYHIELYLNAEKDINTLNNAISLQVFLEDIQDIGHTKNDTRKAKMATTQGNDKNKPTVVYPNPFVDHLQVQTSNANRLEIYTLSGVRVLTSKIHEITKLDLSTLRAGVYIMRLYSINSYEEVKLIKTLY